MNYDCIHCDPIIIYNRILHSTECKNTPICDECSMRTDVKHQHKATCAHYSIETKKIGDLANDYACLYAEDKITMNTMVDLFSDIVRDYMLCNLAITNEPITYVIKSFIMIYVSEINFISVIRDVI